VNGMVHGAGLPGAAPERVPTLVAAGAASWEAPVLERLAASGGHVVLLKRCLDLTDLLATAATGTSTVALVSHALPGLDADSVDRLARGGVRTVVVVPETAADERERMLRLGVTRVVSAAALDDVVPAVREASRSPLDAPRPLAGRPSSTGTPDVPGDGRRETPRPGAGERTGAGRLVVVWGPSGAPGRTTVAIGVAAEAAARGVAVTLLDADPYGGAVAQHLAVLDDASGLLAAARSANAGLLDAERLAGIARQVGTGLRLVSGLPRPDRWPEVRPQAFAEILTTARALDPLVVVDAGFGLSRDGLDAFDPVPHRDAVTTAALEDADDIVVVASADPVGLTRLARGLLDLVDVLGRGPALVVVNRMRSGLGWAPRDVVDMVARVAPSAEVVFVPDDRDAADRALVAGQTLTEGADSALRRGIAEVATRLLGDGTGGALPGPRPGRRRLVRR
jgi:MinD-like ATPase involved in chromosome partitioning or flagellar assembly